METLYNDVEVLIKKAMAKAIEFKMLEKETSGYIVNKDIVLEILKELTEEKPTEVGDIDDKDYPYETTKE